jgi:hypothetical protein
MLRPTNLIQVESWVTEKHGFPVYRAEFDDNRRYINIRDDDWIMVVGEVLQDREVCEKMLKGWEYKYGGYIIKHSDDPYNVFKYMALSIDDCDASILYDNTIKSLIDQINTIND